jgi:hypothetical protein
MDWVNTSTCATVMNHMLIANLIAVKPTESPRAPVCLVKFLAPPHNMEQNISHFHYRNQGAGEQRKVPVLAPAV